jgi:hypothetical protein
MLPPHPLPLPDAPEAARVTLLVWTLVAAGVAVGHGQMHVVGLPLLLIGSGAFLWQVARGGDEALPGWLARRASGWSPPRWPARLRGLPPGLGPPAFLVVLAAVSFPTTWYASGSWLPVSHWINRLAAVAAVASALPALRSRRGAWAVPALLLAAAKATMILAAARPSIDVWYLLQESARGLYDGENMYRQTWAGSPGLTENYPYLPITTVLLAPFHAVFGDVRYGLLAAALLASWWTRRLAPAAPPLIALLLLVFPRSTWSVAQAWTEPMLLAALAGMVLAVQTGRTRWAVVALAVALACKQHVVLLLPVAAMWPALGLRRVVVSALLAAAMVLPWFLWDPAAMIEDAVGANVGLEPTRRSLGLASLALRVGWQMSFVPLLLGLIAAYWVVWRRLPRDAGGFCLGSAFVLLTLDLLNQQSFFNHYTLPLGLLAMAAALRWPLLADPVAEGSEPAGASRRITPR